MKIIYTKHGETISDFTGKDYILKKYKNNEDIKISNDIGILFARVLICQGLMKCEDVEFFYEDEYLGMLNERYEIRHYPEGFCDIHKKNLMIILKKRIKKGV